MTVFKKTLFAYFTERRTRTRKAEDSTFIELLLFTFFTEEFSLSHLLLSTGAKGILLSIAVIFAFKYVLNASSIAFFGRWHRHGLIFSSPWPSLPILKSV
jgi:hypothetical protein